jgi:hypothetical protein
VAQIKFTHVTFICAQIEIYEYTNRIFSVDVEHYLLSYTYYRIPPPLAAAAASAATSATVGATAAAVSAAAVSVDAFAAAANLAAATIAISAAIAAAFWLIVVCPRRCLCFRLPPPFLPAPAVATAAVCRRH